jgi:hypothetical protein
MKLIDQRPADDAVVKPNRKFEAELLRERRSENRQRSIIGYGSFTLFAIENIFVLVLVLLLGLGVLELSDKVIVTLIVGTIAHGAAQCRIVTKSLYSKRE